MPYKKRYQRRRKMGKKAPGNRRYKPKNRRYTKARAVNLSLRSVPGIADSMFVKLNYVERVNLAGAAVVDYIFRGNSLFDPNFTGTGHQPLYFDQYAALYTRYRVYGSSCKLDIINASTTEASQIALVPRDDVTAITDLTTADEYGRSKASRMVPITQQYPLRIKDYCSTRKALGVTKIEAGDQDLSSLVTTNPNSAWWWHIVGESVDGLANVNLIILVKLTYYAHFYDPVNVSQS